MFRRPLRRDPLVVGWAVLVLLAAMSALDANTTWHGHLDPDLVGRFLFDTLRAALWAWVALVALASLRAAWAWWRRRRARAVPAPTGPAGPPWTDGWLRASRPALDERRAAPDAQQREPLPLTCRHGVPVDTARAPVDGPPVLRALSASHTVVQPGSRVSVTWCFERCDGVLVDGHPGHPACGEALVPVRRSRRIEVVGIGRGGETRVATPTVVALAASQVTLPAVGAPPPISLRTDVTATVGGAAPATARLDDLWTAQDRLRPAAPPAPRLVGVPESVVARVRRDRPASGGVQ